jgi:hypothetical protein
MIVGSNILAGASGQQGYFLNRSVRLRSSASAYFNRAVATTSSTVLWSFSGWIKLGTLGVDRIIFMAGASATEFTALYFDTSNRFNYVTIVGGAITSQLISTPVYRDPSSWYHLIFVYDSAQATSSNRLKLYINGVQVTVFTTATYPSISAGTYINNSVSGGLHTIGKSSYSSASYYDGYLTEINFVDGQALLPASVGAFNPVTGVWQPIKYSGTYGTNGFYLNFNDNSAATAAAIGKDSSGNGNNWTPNGISVTAGVTYDSMTDVPTLTSTTQSNFAVLNPVNKGVNTSTSDGNLAFTSTGSTVQCRVLSTLGMSSGKWYCEYTAISASTLPVVGIALSTESPDSGFCGFTIGSYGYYALNGNKYNNGSAVAYGATWGLNDVIGIAYDADAGSLTYYKNGTSQGVAFTGIPSGIYNFCQGDYTATYTGAFNFGQRPFSYTPPSGFKALNTYNLPTPTIANGARQFAATLYTATGTTPQTITNTVNGVSIQPDLVWTKSRSTTNNNILNDSVRGSQYYLYSNLINAENNDATYLTSFNSNGFSLGTGNFANGTTMVGWQWKASNTTAVTNTSGSISSQVSANPSAGFSIVTFTEPASGAFTIGHGLGVAPSMFIYKDRSIASIWSVYHRSTGTGRLQLESTAAVTAGVFTTAPTSTTIALPASYAASATAVAYCFSEIAGYSRFGSYTGNFSTDGTFVYLGFRPRFLMIKTSTSTDDWVIIDTSRAAYNVAQNALSANTAAAEASPSYLDILSNGFKIRQTFSQVNANGATYIYAAFAENPFNYSLAR